MTIESLFDRLFPRGHDIAFDGAFFTGRGLVGIHEVAVVGTCDKAPIDAKLAFRMADAVLSIIRDHPARPIFLPVDTSGQKLSRRDEILGLNSYVAHLAKSLDLARRRGHPIIGLVYGEAVSAGFLSSSLLADACYALLDAEVRVMNLPAMSRVTKIPLSRLEELSKVSAVFAPGVANYVAMGAVRGFWEGDLADCLVAAIEDESDPGIDRRRIDGEARGGRTLARKVSERVRNDAI